MQLDAALAVPFVQRLSALLDARIPIRRDEMPSARMAAVALLLRIEPDGSPEILLIKRAEYEGDPWSGHVALPGGRHEADDISLEHTAIRETREEIALDIELSGRVIGTLDDVAPASPRLPPIVIRPFVVIVDSTAAIAPTAEVAAAFWIPVERVRDPVARVHSRVMTSVGDLSVPGYRLGDHFVWGLTERILRNFFECVDAS
jgi:8-oxo-dGTP pyrophosphatase MutT (NUDIX family)